MEIVFHHEHGLRRQVTVRQCSISSNIPMTRPRADKSNTDVSFPKLAAVKITNVKAIREEGTVKVRRFFRALCLTLNLDGGVQFIYL